MTLSCPDPHWLDSADELASILPFWLKQPVLAVDTEFMRSDTFYPVLGLIQVSDGEQCWLLDPLAKMSIEPLAELFNSPDVLKVFHACSEDLEVLQLAFQEPPQHIFDTQIAAAFIGEGFGCGYNRLLQQMLQVELDKHETRSDWLQRPLTRSQCHYAAEDVYYLFHLYQRIAQKLSEQHRYDWVMEDMRQLLDKARNPIAPDTYYQKVKGAWKLDQRQLAALKLLCEWREQQAMQLNRPRGRVVKDNELLTIALRCPSNLSELAEQTGLHPGQIRRHGNALLALLEKAASLEANELPELLPDKLAGDSKALFRKIRTVIEQLAEQQAIAREQLASKQDMEQLARFWSNSEHESGRLGCGWRAELANPLLEPLLVEFSKSHEETV